MIVARGLEQASLARKKLQASHPGTVRPVVTIGFFDGFHLGHQQVVADLHGWSRELGGQPVVVTFDRHPQEVLRGREPFTVTSLDQRLLFLARAGVEMALVLRFQLEMALWFVYQLDVVSPIPGRIH